MTAAELVLTIALIMAATIVTRFLPFVLFPSGRTLPRFVEYLGKVLPYAVISILVVYCLKGVSVAARPYGIPETAALVVVALLHLWRRNMLISITGGTVVYMLILQLAV